MIRTRFLIVFCALALSVSGVSRANVETGLFRTIPVGTPKKGTLWLSNGSSSAKIPTNAYLRDTYGVSNSQVVNSMSYGIVGITDWLGLSLRFPFYADMFKQGKRSGEKTGPGDVAAGFRVTWLPDRYFFRGLSFGLNATIPETFGYGREPLGFRTFSNGEFAYNAEVSIAFEPMFVKPYLSASYVRFHNAGNSSVLPTDAFYESSYGYLGIGETANNGYAATIFQDHVTLTGGVEIPIQRYLSGLIETNAAFFTEKPARDNIIRIAPGIRIGRQNSFSLSMGIDIRISGSIPDRSYLMKVTIPFIRPARLIRRPVAVADEEPQPKELVRSRNSLVAVNDFYKSDQKFLYEREMKEAFRSELSSMGIMDLISDKKVKNAYQRANIVPLKDSPERFGIRLGANYVINTDINEYTITREKGFSIPFIIGFPNTAFVLKARAVVTDLVKGETRDLGEITATLRQQRGMLLFPKGESSDLNYMSEPERSRMEKQLVNLWVEQFNELIYNNLDVFSWEPKRTEIKGDEETSG